MGLFKNLAGDILEGAKNEAKKRLEEAKSEAKKRLEEAKYEALKKLQEVSDKALENQKQDLSNSYDDEDEEFNEDDVKIQLGTFENGVLTIDEGHTTLDGDSLDGYKNIRKIIFPSTLEEIESNFFADHNEQLEEVDFSKVTLLKVIPEYLFYKCKQLKEISIPEGVETIEGNVFDDCESLRKVTFPSTLKTLDSTISECESLEEVDFSKVTLLKVIPEYFFWKCTQLKEISIPEGVETIENGVFDDCESLWKITFPSTLKTLESTTSGCKNLEEIDLSKSHHLEEIPDYFIYENCQIETLVIPEGVETIGDEFAASESIKEIYIPKTVEKVGVTGYRSRADVYLYSDKITDIEDLCGHINTLYVPVTLYTYYDVLLKDIADVDVDVQLMPADKVCFYKMYATDVPVTPPREEEKSEPEESVIAEAVCPPTMPSMPEMPKESNPVVAEAVPTPTVQKSPGNLFSDGLEELINSVAQSDEITDKKKEIILRRAVKEGEDPDEVEMVLEARFFKAHNK